MADILIRGIEMPKNCMACSDPYEPFSMHRKCHVDGHVFCYSYVHGRDKDCPLVELPEHGDLIDRSKLSFVCGGTTPMEMDYVRRYIVDGMPVVIPSNKEETE